MQVFTEKLKVVSDVINKFSFNFFFVTENFSVLTKMKGSELIKNDKKYFNIDTCDFIIRSNKVLFDFVSDTASGAVGK